MGYRGHHIAKKASRYPLCEHHCRPSDREFAEGAAPDRIAQEHSEEEICSARDQLF
jgi:hypothetical protein